MKFKSALVTQVSGSIGGMTGSHNRGGMYFRARSIPTNPVSTFQQQVRSAFTTLVNRWTESLNATQRSLWNTYGQNVSVTDPLGDPRFLSGQQWYIACNTPRVQATTKLSGTPIVPALIDSAPAIFDRGDFTTPTIGATDYDQSSGLSLNFTTADAWVDEDGAAMLIFQGLPGNASVNFFKGPFRLVGVILGDSGTPPTSPAGISAATIDTVGFSIVTGQASTFHVAVTRADARLSTRRFVARPTAT